MGFVKRYWQEAEEKQLPHYRRIVIVELESGVARVQRRGFANMSEQEFPELPLEFPTYQEAFAWVERKLTPRAPDGGESVPEDSPFETGIRRGAVVISPAAGNT